MTNWARSERELLCDLFLEVGPDAPTLSGAWTARDLAAHLVVRERRPDSAPGIIIGALAGYTEKIRRKVAGGEWGALVETVRSGPPVWSPTRLGAIDELANTVEFFVHHEDVRRGSPGWEPRSLDPEFEAALWGALRRMGRLLARKAPTGVVMIDAAQPDRTITLKSGSPLVTVTGSIGELVLFVYGRQANSRVELVGAESDVAALTNARFGI